VTTLGLAMIVRDEEDSIGAVLADATTFCDELVVVDTGSADATVERAQAAGAQVHHFPWIDDFAAARNAAFGHCHSDWIVWLDADDHVPETAQAGFRQVKQQLCTEQVDAILVPYRLFDGDAAHSLLSYDRERLLRRGASLRWEGAVHEAIAVPAGRFVRTAESGIEAWVEHRPRGAQPVTDRNLTILQRLVDGGDRSPRTLFYLANELKDHARHEEAVPIYREYLSVAVLDWEAYDARVRLAQCLTALGREADGVEAAGVAMALDPSRAEAPMFIGRVHYAAQQWAKAAPMFLAATAATRPAWGFSDDAAYSHLPWDYLGVCLHQLGQQREALDATLRALESSPDQQRLRDNLRFIVERM
jgi:tetratricopeptide (TPR) repeat protein